MHALDRNRFDSGTARNYYMSCLKRIEIILSRAYITPEYIALISLADTLNPLTA